MWFHNGTSENISHIQADLDGSSGKNLPGGWPYRHNCGAITGHSAHAGDAWPEDAMVPFDKGRRLAAGNSNAKFIPLEGSKHVLLADDPGFKRNLGAVELSLSE